MSDERRCDGCAYWQELLPQANHPGRGCCHHTEGGAAAYHPEIDSWVRMDSYWCNHWWPRDEPLPRAWQEHVPCPHGDYGVCMYCLRDAIIAALGGR